MSSWFWAVALSRWGGLEMWMGGWVAKTNHDICCGLCFITYHQGLPPYGSPLVFLLPRFLCRASLSRPHPFGEGRGSWGSNLASRELRHWWSSPHPSEEGRGSYLRHCVSFWAKGGGEGEGWWWKDEREWAKINRDRVDGGFKLRYHSQITFNMNICKSDSQIKNCVIYKCCKDIRSQISKKNMQNYTCYLRNKLKWG